MTIQTLVVTTNREDFNLVSQMNIQTDAIVGNQCGKNSLDIFNYNGNAILFLSSDTKGVGINRNMVLVNATADISVFADDDMIFSDGYSKTVKEWFNKLPDADILIFNLNEKIERRFKNKKITKINRFNYAKYGAARLAFLTKSIKSSSIMFNTMFGGGCKYSCGEDTIFLKDCLRRGLKIYGVPATIATIEDGNSTWFSGYNDKYFFDKGVLYSYLSEKFSTAHALYHVVKYRKKYKEYGIKNAFLQMQKGIRSVEK